MYQSSKSGLALFQMKLFKDEATTCNLLAEAAGSGWLGKQWNRTSMTWSRVGDTVVQITKAIPKRDDMTEEQVFALGEFAKPKVKALPKGSK